MTMTNTLLENLPHTPGVYLMRDRAANILYIGKAIDLRKRVANYFRPTGLEPKIRALMAEVRHIDYIVAASEREALIIEQRLIHRHQPLYNTMWKDGKSYPFVKISMGEDFPRLRLIRKKDRDGGLYFGPYPNVRGVRRLLDWVWRRKLFSLRPCDLEFSVGHLPEWKEVKSCLYLHTGECPAPCVGKISRDDYRKSAERAALFFAGKSDDLRAAWEREMREAADALEFERAAALRDHVQTLDHVGERVTFRALKEDDVQNRLQQTQSVNELQTALDLPRAPFRIEGFDISHVQGADTVASMVSFAGGKPDKSNYRKFKIKTVAGVDDFASMAEVITRRYARLKASDGPWPDLILIDGGPGQLSAATTALQKVTSRELPICSLAKREEEVFLPGRAEPVRLERSSAALQLLQRVRDESHRFAVSFHRARRTKRLFNEG
jgi:excinuclease ABC subunit C